MTELTKVPTTKNNMQGINVMISSEICVKIYKKYYVMASGIVCCSEFLVCLIG